MSRLIPLAHQLVCAIVDDEDFELVSSSLWHLHEGRHTNYARGYVNGKHVYLHRYLLGAVDGQPVDHVNRNGLDCTRRNIRITTVVVNTHNTTVTWGKLGVRNVRKLSNGKYKLEIKIRGKKYKKSFDSIKQAVERREELLKWT